MRLGFHYHVPAATREGRIAVPGYLGRFVDSLAGRCERLTLFLHSPRPAEETLLDYVVCANNIELVGIGPHSSVPIRMLLGPWFTRRVAAMRGELDVLLVRGPSPLLASMVAAARPLPTVLLLVGDYVAGVNDLAQPRWRKEIIRLWSRWNLWQQTRAAQRSLTFVNSRKLFRELEGRVPHLLETRTTTLTVDDFFVRDDTCQDQQVRLLYSGRLDRGKGLLDVVEALALLSSQGQDVVLDLVGWPEPGDPILEDIQARARARGVGQRVRYVGYRKLGEPLFACYRQADLFVTASVRSEGFPRTIWEAMAHSLPVVATRVGSIPDFIEGTAELVEPGDPRALAAAITGLIGTPARRRQMIAQGLVMARSVTLEGQVGEMFSRIEEWLAASDG